MTLPTNDAVATAAAHWYDHNARDLPWRVPGTSPWAILVSEVMLQQTPVVRVLPVWNEWLVRWPTPAALAAEPAGEAIRAWGRLGYPRRALRLHECAAVVVSRHDGVVPSALEELLALPGVGTYTARAVAAFAYGQRHPVVDTNVRRLVARAVDGAQDSGTATTARDLVAVERLLPAEPAVAAHVSAALMELGALVCTARSPRCGVCPLERGCAWRANAAGGGAAKGGGAGADGAAAADGRGPDARDAPAPRATGRSRRPQAYAGTDRQVRGLLLAVVRDATGPVPATRLDVVWADATQRRRALASLLADGLVCEDEHGGYVLPGTVGRA